jgi:tetratricopeptide (TPR) repeat protein
MSMPWTRTLEIAIVYARDRADEYLQRAMRNPTALAHQVASEMRRQDRRFDAAIAEAERAIALNPNDAAGYVAMGGALIFGGRAEEAVQFVERATRLDPHAAVNLYLLGLVHFSTGQLDEAAALLERALERSPFNREWSAPLAAIYGHFGRDQEAQAALGNFGGGLLTVWNMLEVWPFKDAAVVDRFATGLIKAGMCCQRDVEEFIDQMREEGKAE